MKTIYTLFSYLSAFILGAYSYAAVHGNTPAGYRWALTIVTGVLFFIRSRQKEE